MAGSWEGCFSQYFALVYSVGHRKRHVESVILFIGEMLLRTLFSTLLSVPNIKKPSESFLLGLVPGEG